MVNHARIGRKKGVTRFRDFSPPVLSQFLATDPEARVRFPALPEKKSSGSGTGSTQPREYN
jgi:hypothetical protein